MRQALGLTEESPCIPGGNSAINYADPGNVPIAPPAGNRGLMHKKSILFTDDGLFVFSV